MNSLEITGFTGINEVASPEKIKPEELTVLTNMRLDEEIGIPTTRKGYNNYLTQVDTSGTINNIFDVKDSNGVNSLLVNMGTKLRKNLSGVWSTLKSGLTSSKMRMTIFGENHIFTNGNETPFYTTDLINVQNLEIARPDVSGMTLTDHAGVTILGIKIGMYIISYLTSDNQVSNASNKIVIVYSDTAGNYVTLNNIPVSSDARVTSKLIFRAKQTGIDLTSFYLVGQIDNSVTTFDDYVEDVSLDTNENPQYINVPDNAKYIGTNSDVVFMANINKTLTNRVINPPQYSGNTDLIIFIDDTQAGNMDAGTYIYSYSLVDKLGNESDLVPLFSHTLASGSLRIDFDLARTQAGIIGYPNGLAQLNLTDAAISLIRLYRTKKNESTIFYFIQDIVLQPGYYVTPYPISPYNYDDKNDTSLTVPYPKATHTNADVESLNSSIVYSNINKPLEFPELNYIEVYPDDSEDITGIFDDDNGIMVFKENSICKLYTVGDPSNWSVQKLVHNVGCDQPDSIYKNKNTFYFVYRNQCYQWAGQGEPQNISYKRKPTFDSVTSFLGATFYNSVLWYVLTVKISGIYYLLAYDTKLDTWYKFTINQADTIFEKKFGTDKGKLLFGGNLFLTFYDQSLSYDFGAQDIPIVLKTKDYAFTDNFITARLMFLFVNYYRLTGTVTKEVHFTLLDPMTGYSKILIDTTEILQPNYYISTDGMTGGLQRCKKLNLTIAGSAISKFYASRLDFNLEPWGVTRKTQSLVEGYGMTDGTKAGVNTN